MIRYASRIMSVLYLILYGFFLLYKSTVKSEKCTILHMTSHLLLSFCESFNQTEEFLTVLSPKMDNHRFKIDSKTLTTIDILERFADIVFCVQARKISDVDQKGVTCCWRWPTCV